MKKEELVEKKVIAVQKSLNRWARKNGVISDDELIFITVYTKFEMSSLQISPEQISPEKFFSMDRLKVAGLTKWSTTRAPHCVKNACYWDFYKNKERSLPLNSMKEFLVLYGDVNELFKIKNLGQVCIDSMVMMIRDAGLQIADSHNLLNR